MNKRNYKTKHNEPLISVLIPTYNCGQFIEEAINSILTQNYDNLEIIVVDDGSTDNTEEIVKRIVETLHATSLQYIRYFRKEHSGISETRNMCLEKAKGEYIAWCDADDYWLQGKLQAQIKYLQEHPECQLVFTQFEDFFDNEEVKKNPIAIGKSDYSANTDNRHRFTTILSKKNIFEKFGNFNPELVTGEDSDFLYKLILNGVNWNHCVEKILYRRRFYGNNIVLLNNGKQYELTTKFVLQNLRKNLKENLVKKM